MEVVRAYVDKYPRSGETGNWFITEDINIQYYKPGAATERGTQSEPATGFLS